MVKNKTYMILFYYFLSNLNFFDSTVRFFDPQDFVRFNVNPLTVVSVSVSYLIRTVDLLRFRVGGSSLSSSVKSVFKMSCATATFGSSLFLRRRRNFHSDCSNVNPQSNFSDGMIAGTYAIFNPLDACPTRSSPNTAPR